ncbi:hypothetical protein ACWDRX_23495, partial [Streptomyces nigra]
PGLQLQPGHQCGHDAVPLESDRGRQQMRGWTPDGVAVALRAVAEADAGVKGGGDDPGYALEKAVVTIARAARSRGRS